MFRPTFGVQLYTLMRHIQTAQDFDTTLEKLSLFGVKDVQISGIGDIAPNVQKEILDKHGMKVCITHKNFERMINDLPALAAEHRLIGCDAIGLGYADKEKRCDYDTTVKFVSQLSDIANKLKKEGMSFNYHNHDFEFSKLDGGDSSIIDIMLNNSSINFVPDVAWMQIAGVDPVEMLYKMRGRIKVIHFKDYSFSKDGERCFVSLGTGKVDLKACYEAAVDLKIPYIVYEQDSGWVNDDAFLATKQSWDYMQSLY